MKVEIIKTGEVQEVEDNFGARLIEQGQAVIAKKAPKAAPAEEPVKAKKAGKGE